ncbi:MAG: lipid II flippase MurJ [Planctomycetota bacterium]
MNKPRTAHPTALLVSTTIVFYGLDVVRSVYLYGRFGPTALDPFYASYVVLEGAVNALMLTALAAVLMPALADAAKTGGEPLAERLGSTVLLLALAVLSVAAACGVVFAPQVLRLYGFQVTPGQALIARLVFGVLPFFGADKVIRLLHERRGQFGPTVAASLIVRVVFLAVVIGFASTLGVTGAGVGSLAAAGVTAAFLLASYLLVGGRLRRPLALGHALVRRTGRRLLPLGIAGFFAQAPLVDSLFARRFFGDGQLSLLRLAWTIYSVPIALFCVSVGTAVFPRMCEAAAADDRGRLAGHIATALRRAMYFTLPAMFGLIVVARPLIRLAYERGEFEPHHTPIVAACLVAFSLGLAAAGARPILARALFALNRHAWYIGVDVLALVLNVGLNVLFAVVFGWGVVGLALSTAVSWWGTMLVLSGLVRRFVDAPTPALRPALLKMAGAAAAMGVVCALAWKLTAGGTPGPPAITAVRLAALVLFGAALYAVATSALRLEENDDVRTLIRKFLGRARRPRNHTD